MPKKADTKNSSETKRYQKLHNLNPVTYIWPTAEISHEIENNLSCLYANDFGEIKSTVENRNQNNS